EAFRLVTDFVDQPLDLVIKLVAQFGIDCRVILNGAHIFLTRFRMKGMPLHRPRMRRMRAETSSPGTPWTSPAWISSIRRLISACQATAVSGSLACKSSVNRLTNSTTFSGAQRRASSTICSTVSGIECKLLLGQGSFKLSDQRLHRAVRNRDDSPCPRI